MKFAFDHDLHIHSHLSICSTDEGQTPAALLEYAKHNNLKQICVTDHYWDSAVPCNTGVNWWYEKQNFEHISSDLPLPKAEGVDFLFGCEADMDSDNRIGLPKSRYDDFDFIIVSTTHFHHMCGEKWEDISHEGVARRWFDRMYAVLDSDLPFHKVGIAHPACKLMNRASREDYLLTLDAMSDEALYRVYKKAAEVGVGIELNSDDFKFDENEADRILRMFKIAKDCGCKFYLGSDAHTRGGFNGKNEAFEGIITLLDLRECDKFHIR
ncbi:MAG: PHP domain-containing protein [Clostridia bacterium]|nr:PHP domain-containing protein [Clostridia bacterium]